MRRLRADELLQFGYARADANETFELPPRSAARRFSQWMQWARLLDRQCSDSFSDHKDSSKSKPIPALSLFFQKTRELRRTGTHLAAFVIDQAATTQVEHQPRNHLARRTYQPGDLLMSQAHAR